MIKINVDNDYKNLRITGHAGYSEHGKDIVCASVSSIVYTSVNLAKTFNKDVEFIDDGSKMLIKNYVDDINVDLTIKNMVLMLEELEKQYPKNLKISKGE